MFTGTRFSRSSLLIGHVKKTTKVGQSTVQNKAARAIQLTDTTIQIEKQKIQYIVHHADRKQNICNQGVQLNLS